MSESDNEESLNEQLGIPSSGMFLDETPPRMPDEKELEAYLRGDLPESQEEEILWLVNSYQEWATAKAQVLLRMTDRE